MAFVSAFDEPGGTQVFKSAASGCLAAVARSGGFSDAERDGAVIEAREFAAEQDRCVEQLRDLTLKCDPQAFD